MDLAQYLNIKKTKQKKITQRLSKEFLSHKFRRIYFS